MDRPVRSQVWVVRAERRRGYGDNHARADAQTHTCANAQAHTNAQTHTCANAQAHARADAQADPGAHLRPASTPAPTSSPVGTASPSVPHTAVLDGDPGAGPGTQTSEPTPNLDSSPSSPSPSPDPVTAGILGGTGSGGTGSGGPGGSDSSGSGGPGPGGAGDGSGSLPGGLSGSSSLTATVLRTLPTVVVTTGGVTMLMAFMMFGKRRRDGEPNGSDDELAEAARRGYGMGGYSGLVPEAAAAPAALQAVIVSAPAGETDQHLPRWRRPSLMEARKNDPLRSASTTVRLTFDGEAGEAVSGLERRLIRYRLVSLLDMPDEVRGVEIDVLDEGDEVVLLEKRGTYWRVLCPDGREGWLHKMTLGDVVIGSSVSDAASWTSGDEDVDAGGFEDVLRAYDEHRRQFGDA